jgi:hypothetical protein
VSRPSTLTGRLGCLCALAASGVACTPTVHWEARAASDFTPSGHTVSVFGVYKDGQMSSEAWDSLRPRLEPLLGGGQCPIARDALADGPLFAAIDDYARTNGPTEDLLAEVGPAAQGDLILVLVEAGQPPAPEAKVSVVNGSGPAGPGPGATSGKAGLAAYAPSRHPGGKDVLELSASLFSVAQGRSVALLDMQYSGNSRDEAEREFTERVGQVLPAVACRGWNWSAPVDPDKIRGLVER